MPALDGLRLCLLGPFISGSEEELGAILQTAGARLVREVDASTSFLLVGTRADGPAFDAALAQPEVGILQEEYGQVQLLLGTAEGSTGILLLESAAPSPATPASRVGGLPLLPPDRTWPLCAHCAEPLTFVLQLAPEQLAAAGMALPGKLLQVFQCTTFEPRICPAIGGTEAYPVQIVSSAGASPRKVPLWLEHLERWHDAAVGAELLAVLEAMAEEAGLEEEWLELRPALQELLPEVGRVDWYQLHTQLEARGLDIEALGVEDGDSQRDMILRGVSGLRLEPFHHGYEAARRLARQRGATVLGQLAGAPSWVQSSERPECCGQPMRFLAQFQQAGGGGINFGDSGCGYLFGCSGCRGARLLMQSC